jgi:integrase
MPRRPSGTIIREGDHFVARLTLPDGSRPRVRLEAGISEERAREAARLLAERAARGELTRPTSTTAGPTETVDAWFTRWFADRAARGIVTAKGEAGRFRKWISPVLGAKPIVDVTTRDLEMVVELLDRASHEYATAEREKRRVDKATMCSWKTAFNVWGIVRTGFSDAARSKTLALRAIATNPAEKVRGPDKGAEKARTYLPPSTFASFIANPDVPILWRRVVAIATYTYARASELRALDWADVHLDEGFIMIHQTEDAAGEVGTVKSERPRRVPIEKELVPLLEAMRAESGGRGRVMDLVDDRHLARALRTWLRVGGHETAKGSATTAELTFHDLRATGVTWRCVRGDDVAKIKASAGHKHFSTTDRYMRDADVLGQWAGTVFPPLARSLLQPETSGVQPTSRTPKGASMRNHERILVEAAGIEPASARFLMHPRSRA